MKKITLFLTVIICLLAVGLFYFRYQIYYSHGNSADERIFEIKKGEKNSEIAKKMETDGIISNKMFFYCYVKMNNVAGKVLPGIYKLNGNMTIPEIVRVITSSEDRRVKITFPEGWDSKKMAVRLSENGLPGDDFLKIVGDVDRFRDKYDFLSDTKIKSLEGYLFPDTYYFPPDSGAETIIKLMLNNFNARVSSDVREEIKKQKKTLLEIVTMASILEMEVKSKEDREAVSGIFWNRISIGMPLQSCATLAYVLGVDKKQYSYEDTQIDSNYNTYQNKGLPPGPIDNPGIVSIQAAIFPRDTNYLYFLSDPKTGKTFFAKTLDEQNANKAKCGL